MAAGAQGTKPHQAKGSERSPSDPLAALGSLWSCPHTDSARCHAPHPWRTTEELCQELAISRSTLFALRKSGLLKPGRHLVPKNPACSRSRLLWHLQRCELALGRLP